MKKGTKTISTPPKKEEEVLNIKEVKELQPRIKEALKTFFTYFDKGIGYTTKKVEMKKVYIWSTIDNDELDVLTNALLESATRSKIMAGTVRKISRSYQMLQVQLITLPRFIMTIQHYMNNGFELPFGGNK